jgi:hypothetical protein
VSDWAALFDAETGIEGKVARDKRRGVYELYVGISKNPGRRWNQHSQTKYWWGQVGRHEVVWFDSRPSALLAEHRAMISERPVHNSLHDPQGLYPGVKKPPVEPLVAATLGVKGTTVDSIIKSAEREGVK